VARRTGRRATIVGAGIAGLAAAKALSPFFDEVVVLERDLLPEGPRSRPGTPQDRHIHGLLAGGCEALSALFPDFRDDLERAGAVKARGGRDVWMERPGYDPFPQRDLGRDMFGLSRPLIERLCRLRVAETANITLRSCARVTELVASPDGRAVVGVAFRNAEGGMQTIEAELTVDASGRGAPTLGLLARLQRPKPEEIEIGVDLAYATALVDIPADAPTHWTGLMILPDPAESTRAGYLFPIENRRWLVALSAMHGDAPPGDVEGFLAFAKGLRRATLYEAIKGARFVGDIARYLFPASLRRRFDPVDGLPRGLVPIGDSICRFSPLFGQGMSVAALEAQTLGRLLDGLREGPGPLEGLASAFLGEIEAIIEAPWAVAETDFAYEQTRGARPPELAERLRRSAAFVRLAAEDEAVHRLAFEVRNLVKPHSALSEPALAARVRALLACSD
jgi:2-polyprenyl-6-methoxyphenol hydroxylase-like FAD-dependent oxidoreductase